LNSPELNKLLCDAYDMGQHEGKDGKDLNV
jgi:hypothetical protein